MSVHDETWDRPICDYCNKIIMYGKKSKHLDGKCMEFKTKVINIKSGEPYDVYIGRARHGKDGFFGNPHTMGGVYCPACKSYHDRNSAIEAFKKDFYKRIEVDKEFKKRVLELKGKTLGCFCKNPNFDVACHGDIYVEYLDSFSFIE